MYGGHRYRISFPCALVDAQDRVISLTCSQRPFVSFPRLMPKTRSTTLDIHGVRSYYFPDRCLWRPVIMSSSSMVDDAVQLVHSVTFLANALNKYHSPRGMDVLQLPSLLNIAVGSYSTGRTPLCQYGCTLSLYTKCSPSCRVSIGVSNLSMRIIPDDYALASTGAWPGGVLRHSEAIRSHTAQIWQ